MQLIRCLFHDYQGIELLISVYLVQVSLLVISQLYKDEGFNYRLCHKCRYKYEILFKFKDSFELQILTGTTVKLLSHSVYDII